MQVPRPIMQRPGTRNTHVMWLTRKAVECEYVCRRASKANRRKMLESARSMPRVRVQTATCKVCPGPRFQISSSIFQIPSPKQWNAHDRRSRFTSPPSPSSSAASGSRLAAAPPPPGGFCSPIPCCGRRAWASPALMPLEKMRRVSESACMSARRQRGRVDALHDIGIALHADTARARAGGRDPRWYLARSAGGRCALPYVSEYVRRREDGLEDLPLMGS